MHEKAAVISAMSAGRFCFPPVAFVSRRLAAQDWADENGGFWVIHLPCIVEIPQKNIAFCGQFSQAQQM